MKLQIVLIIWWLQLLCSTFSSKNFQRRKSAENSNFSNEISANTSKGLDPVKLHEKKTNSTNPKGDSFSKKPSYAEKVKKYSSQNDVTINTRTTKVSTNELTTFGIPAREWLNKTNISPKIDEKTDKDSNYASCLTDVKIGLTCSTSERVSNNSSMIVQKAKIEKDVLGNFSNTVINNTQESPKTFRVRTMEETEILKPNISADTVYKNDLPSNQSAVMRNKNWQNHSSNANYYEVLHNINELKMLDSPKSSKMAKVIAMGYESVPDKRAGTKRKYLLHSISVYDGEKFIYGVENIKHPPIHQKILKTWKKGVYDKSEPDSITEIRKKISNLIQDKIVILYNSFLLNFFNDERSPILFIRDTWCLHKFIRTIRKSELNCQRYEYHLDNLINYFMSSEEQNMLYSKDIKLTNAELMAKALWILYDKLKIKWENELNDLFGNNDGQTNNYKETTNGIEIPHRGIHCDLEKYTLESLFPNIEKFNFIFFIDFEVDDAKNEAKQISILKQNGKSDVIIFRSRADNYIQGKEPWLMEKRHIMYGTNEESKPWSRAVNMQKIAQGHIKNLCDVNAKFIAHQNAKDFIKYQIVSRNFLKKYSKCFIDLRAVLRGRGVSEEESNISLKNLSIKYLHLHYEADQKLSSITRAAICGQLYQIFRFVNKPKVIFDDLESDQFKFQV